MNQSKKQKYEAPLIEVIRMENEGVMASSISDMSEIKWGTSGNMGNSYKSNSVNAASGSDLEDLINDILTVEN